MRDLPLLFRAGQLIAWALGVRFGANVHTPQSGVTTKSGRLFFAGIAIAVTVPFCLVFSCGRNGKPDWLPWGGGGGGDDINNWDKTENWKQHYRQ